MHSWKYDRHKNALQSVCDRFTRLFRRLPHHRDGLQSEVIAAVKSTLALDRDDPTKPDAITALRKQTNDWVAKYRRDASFAGRPSYGYAKECMLSET
jgi:Photosystem II Pbs27